MPTPNKMPKPLETPFLSFARSVLQLVKCTRSSWFITDCHGTEVQNQTAQMTSQHLQPDSAKAVGEGRGRVKRESGQ